MPLPGPSNKRDILRAVYEDNLRVSDPSAVPPRRRRPGEATSVSEATGSGPWTQLGAAFMAFALLAVVFIGTIGQGGEPSRAEAQAAPGPSTPLVSLQAPGASTRLDDVLAAQRSAGEAASVPMAELFNLQVNTIVLDPGHGGRDPGTLGATGLAEKEITLDVARRLQRRLEARGGMRILLTRDGDDALALGDRVAFANERGADLFVSLHVNSIPDRSLAPLETYYFGLRADDETLQLAHGENATADYTVAEFNDLLQQAGTTVKAEESQKLARAVQQSLVATVREDHADADDWGVKAGPFVVLLGVEAPAILAEMAALSNPDEEARLGTPSYREALARSLEEGIVAYLRERPPPPTASAAPAAVSPTSSLYGQEENS